MSGVVELPLDIEIEKKLEDHDGKIRQLELQSVRTEEKLNSLTNSVNEIKKSMERMENTMLNTQNSILNGVNQLIINKDNNKTKIIIQVLILAGVILTSLFAGAKIVGG